MAQQQYELALLDFDWLQEMATEYQENLNNGFQGD